MNLLASPKDQKAAARNRLTEVAARRNALIADFAAKLEQLDEEETIPAIVAGSRPVSRLPATSGYADQLVSQHQMAAILYSPEADGLVLQLSVHYVRRIIAAAKDD